MAYPPPPYADAVCGGFVCGEAICGTWWAYPASAPLSLGGYSPEIVILTADQVPIAGLALGAFPVELVIEHTLAVAPAGVALGAEVPAFRISASIAAPQSGLALGAIVPRSVGRLFITAAECVVLTPAAPAEYALALAAPPESDIALDPVECR